MQVNFNNHPEKDKRQPNYSFPYLNNMHCIFTLFTGPRKLVTWPHYLKKGPQITTGTRSGFGSSA